MRPDLEKRIPIVKGEDEQYVLGVVLVPEEVDSQGDVYSAEEVRRAAHRFMEEYQTVGVMHREGAGPQTRVVESYVAPVDFQVGEYYIKQGTWLLGIHVDDLGLWRAIKAGELTGLSIGGSAVRRPVEFPNAAEIATGEPTLNPMPRQMQGAEQKFTPEQARAVGDRLGVDWDAIDAEQFRLGLGVEMEHWATAGHDLDTIGRIVLDHLAEDPFYYAKLDRANL